MRGGEDGNVSTESITGAELRAAIDRLGWNVQHEPGIPSSTHPADRIIRDVERHREPEYEPGGVYQDADGDVFKYCNELAGDTPWLGFTGELYAHGHVSQPLHKMVPEGSPLADSERDLIRRDLGQLLDLLGLGDHARPASSHEVFVMCLEEVAKLAGDREGTCPGGC